MKGLYSLYLAIFIKGDEGLEIDEIFAKEIKVKQKYNTKVNKDYFKKKKFQQWGAKQKNGSIPILEDDLDIMEREDIFDTMDGYMI
jgi:hypothetical protein